MLRTHFKSQLSPDKQCDDILVFARLTAAIPADSGPVSLLFARNGAAPSASLIHDIEVTWVY